MSDTKITVSIKAHVDEAGNSIDEDNRAKYYLCDQEISLADLQAVIEQEKLSTEKLVIAIYADQEVPIDNIVQIMNIAKDNGCSVILATAPE